MNLYRVIAAAILSIPAAGVAHVVIPGSSVALLLHQNSSGQLIATVQGQIPPCGLVPTHADPTFTIADKVITVTQPLIAADCTNPPPPDENYIATVNFGRLFDGTYTVNWNIPSLSEQYTISGNPGISAAFSGNWFDPNQSGQGFEIEILGNGTAMSALWFTFAPGGGETWIGASGPISGTQATLVAYQVTGTGALFPPHFDAAHVTAQPWGSLKFTFSDCNTGRVDWASTQPGYGSGTMALKRLTMPDGLACP